MLELLIAVTLLASNARHAGERGRRRFGVLPDERAQVVHESIASGVYRWIIVLTAVVSAVNAIVAGFQRWWVGLVMAVGALMLLLVASRLGRSAQSNVEAGLAERRLAPLHQRETSARRARRQKQLAVVALTGYVGFRVLGFAADEAGETWLMIPALLSCALAAGGALGLVWSMAWRFGDEEPA